MSTIWTATHVGVERDVAIKLFSLQHAGSADLRRRFDTEAKAVARLQSKYVAQVYDNGELADGTPFIAMELLRGESLHAKIRRIGPIPLPEAVRIVSQVCRALGKAHSLGIVHRDIKPENIFLARSDDEDDDVAKVLDFGIAKLSGGKDPSATQTGAFLGTPLYMSPEQALGLRSIDHRSDLYSLGLVIYTMLTGKRAYAIDSFGELIVQICTRPLPSLSANASWLPPSIDAWFEKACARDRDQRFGTAQELAEGLASVAGMSTSIRTAAPASGTSPLAMLAIGPPRGSSPPVEDAATSGPSQTAAPDAPVSVAPAPSIVAPMTMPNAKRAGPGSHFGFGAFVAVLVLAVGGALMWRFSARDRQARDATEAAGFAQSSIGAPPRAADVRRRAAGGVPTAITAPPADASDAIPVAAPSASTSTTTEGASKGSAARSPSLDASSEDGATAPTAKPWPPPRVPAGKPRIDLGY